MQGIRKPSVFGSVLVTVVMPLNALARPQAAPAQMPSQVEVAIPAAVAPPDVPPLTSNRPGIADSEALVPPGAFQVEAGAQVQDAPSEGELRWTQTWGQLTFRYGLAQRVEIFGGWDGLSLDRVALQGD